MSKGIRIGKSATTRLLRRSIATAPAVAAATTSRQARAVATGLVVASTAFLLNNNNKTYNHCQVPCGIFDDPAMVAELQQAVATISKAMAQTQILVSTPPKTAQDEALAVNQAVRWISVKEEHANKIIATVADYCLCQRVKRGLFADQMAYYETLAVHHKVMQAAMKTKQSVSAADCIALQEAVNDLAKMYTK